MRHTRKAISHAAHRSDRPGHREVQRRARPLPAELNELAPHYVDASLLRDPWGNPYKYLQPANRYLVIGFTADGTAGYRPVPSRASAVVAPATRRAPQTGGIRLVE